MWHKELHCTLRNTTFCVWLQAWQVSRIHTAELDAALDHSKTTPVVTLDIKGTFDRMWHSALLTKLSAGGVNRALLHVVTDYLQGKFLKVTTGGRKSTLHPIRAAVPLESCLGTLLWNVYMNDLL